MKNKISIYIIVVISLIVAMLHFATGPQYDGPFKLFINGYLIDIILPLNVYLLFQISLRKKLTLNQSRMFGALATFFIGITVEILQYFEMPVFGQTYDPWDFLMYALGTLMGFAFDTVILDRFENK
jgi:hypothetical protein